MCLEIQCMEWHCRGGNKNHPKEVLGLIQPEELIKEKFSFLHIKPYNKDISDHIRGSTAGVRC